MSAGAAWFLLLFIELAVAGATGPALGIAGWLEVLWGATFLCLPLLVAALAMELARGSGRRLLAGAAAVAGGMLLLNVQAFQRGFALVPIGFAAAVAAAGTAAWLAPRQRGVKAALLALALPLAVGLSIANRTLYPTRYPLQHLSLSLLCLWGLVLGVDAVLGQVGTRRLRAVGLALLAVALVTAGTFVGLRNGRMDLAAAAALSSEMPSARVGYGLARGLWDRDGDGYGNLLLAADCDDSDPAVNPAADEIAGNGKDDNCLGGDAPYAPQGGDERGDQPDHQPSCSSVSCPPAGGTRAGGPGGGGRSPPRPSCSSVSCPPAGGTRASGPCGGASSSPPLILLITIDSLRPDRVWGDLAGATAPFLRDLSGRCVRFTQAYAAYGSTLPSAYALLYSRYPSQGAGERACGHFRAPVPDTMGVAAAFRAGGWEARAAVGTWLLGPKCGLTGAFTQVLVDPVELFEELPRAAEVTALARQALAGPRPAFVWVHYMDPHEPYYGGHENPGAGVGTGREAAYNGEVRNVDDEVAKLVARLPEGSAVVVAADHGEELRGRDPIGHLGLSREALHVPVLVCAPGLAAREVAEPVSLLDLGPTLLALAGIPVPGPLAGESLLPAARGEGAVRGWAAAEYVHEAQGGVLSRAVFGPDWEVRADLGLGLFSVVLGGVVERSLELAPGSAAADAYLDLAERVLARDASRAPAGEYLKPR